MLIKIKDNKNNDMLINTNEISSITEAAIKGYSKIRMKSNYELIAHQETELLIDEILYKLEKNK